MIYMRLFSVQFGLFYLPQWTLGDTYNTEISDELLFGTTAAKLEFWEPKKIPHRQYSGRRKENSIDHPSRHRNRETNRQTTRENVKGHYKLRVATTSDGELGDYSSTETDRGTHSTSRKPYAHKTHSDERPYKISAITRETKKHQKKQALRNRRSTRMTPLYLMQHSDKSTKATTKTSRETTDIHTAALNVLRPYALDRQLNRILENFPEVNGSMEVIGRTTEYNNIILLKLTSAKGESANFRADSKYIDEVPEKKIVFIVHGLSVMGLRFVQALTTETYFETLLSFYINHLDKFDIFLIPMANPDGFGETNVRPFWCKNLSPQSVCAGVNLDRNFDVAWNTSKLSSPCSNLFPGTSPFSEPETKAIRDVLHHYGHRLVAYIHVHASSIDHNVFRGDGVLYPKGYTEIQSDDDQYIDLKSEIDEAMRNASFQVMSVAVETLNSWYGTISGSSVDYASSVYGIPYSLEFVMQAYENEITDTFHAPKEQTYDYIALIEIWKRIIDVVFNNIWKNFEVNDVRKYF